MQTKIVQWKIKIKSLQTINQNLKLDYTKLHKLQSKLQQKVRQTDLKNSQLQSKNDQLRTEIIDLSNDVTALKSQLKRKQECNNQFQNNQNEFKTEIKQQIEYLQSVNLNVSYVKKQSTEDSKTINFNKKLIQSVQRFNQKKDREHLLLTQTQNEKRHLIQTISQLKGKLNEQSKQSHTQIIKHQSKITRLSSKLLIFNKILNISKQSLQDTDESVLSGITEASLRREASSIFETEVSLTRTICLCWSKSWTRERTPLQNYEQEINSTHKLFSSRATPSICLHEKLLKSNSRIRNWPRFWFERTSVSSRFSETMKKKAVCFIAKNGRPSFRCFWVILVKQRENK